MCRHRPLFRMRYLVIPDSLLQAEAVLLLADALGLEKPNLLGWSSGGNTGLVLAGGRWCRQAGLCVERWAGACSALSQAERHGGTQAAPFVLGK